MTASGHSDFPGGQGNAYADDVTGSGQKTATGIDPRIETGLPENESAHVESGSGQKTATDRDATAHGQRVTSDREQEEERERERRPLSTKTTRP